jgi:putative ABC transport system permease protein
MLTFQYAARTLLKSRGFTAVAVATLALGIGANTAVFSLIRAVFLSPLPVVDADRLISVTERRPSSGDSDITLSAHEYAAWKSQNQTLAGIALYRPDMTNLTGSGEPQKLQLFRTSADFFQVLGVQAAHGRLFAAGEDRDGFDRVVVLSHELWQRGFGGDLGIIGRKITLNDQPHEVIGILRPLPQVLSADAWVPLDVPGNIRTVGRHNLSAIGRLAAGVTIEQARADLATISARTTAQYPRENTGHNVGVRALRDAMVGELRPAMLTLLAAAGFVLLIACANVMNLLLTRGATRQKELAVRAALGASRGRLVRDLLAESLLVALVGGAAGVLLAAWIVDAVPALPAIQVPLADTARLDWQTLAVAAVMAALTGLIAGIAPALRGAKQHPSWLREGSRTSDDPARRRMRMALVAVETALALMLLAGAGLMINSFLHLVRVDAGFSTERVLVASVELPPVRYATANQQRAFFDRLHAGLASLPGVETVGSVSHLPLGGSENYNPLSIVGRPPAEPGQELYAPFRTASPEYFRAMGIPLVRGRFFTDSDARVAVPLIRWYPQQPPPEGFDRPQAAPVTVISEAAARRFFPAEDPIGKRIRVNFSPEVIIVGIVGDVKHNALNMPAYPHMYLAQSQEVWNWTNYVIKTSVGADSIAGAVRAQVAAVDPHLPVTVRTMDAVRSESIGQPRLYVLLVGCFAAVALGLAVVGIFGVVSHMVVQRTREIGVRVALGAEQRAIQRLVITQGMRPVVVGVATGILGAWALTGSMEKLLFEVQPNDPLTFAIVVVLLASVATAACWIPARRAARLDPIAALRAE